MSCIADEVGFVHLRVHSAYSLLEGALQIKKLAGLAKADRMPALGLADTGNLFGALEFAEKMVESGVQPIVGCQVAIDFGDTPEPDRPGAPRQKRLSDIVLIAASEAGYWNLVRLVSSSFMETSPSDRAHLAVAALEGSFGRPDCAHRRPRRADRPGDRGRAGRSCGRAARPARSALPGPALCRASAPLHAGRGGGRAASPRSRLCPRPAAGRDQRGVLPGAWRLRGP